MEKNLWFLALICFTPHICLCIANRIDVFYERKKERKGLGPTKSGVRLLQEQLLLSQLVTMHFFVGWCLEFDFTVET